jgi:hypothetical protein
MYDTKKYDNANIQTAFGLKQKTGEEVKMVEVN